VDVLLSAFYGLIDRVPSKFSHVTVLHVTLVEYGRHLPYIVQRLATPKKVSDFTLPCLGVLSREVSVRNAMRGTTDEPSGLCE
jgi:hypothetical protein